MSLPRIDIVFWRAWRRCNDKLTVMFSFNNAMNGQNFLFETAGLGPKDTDCDKACNGLGNCLISSIKNLCSGVGKALSCFFGCVGGACKGCGECCKEACKENRGVGVTAVPVTFKFLSVIDRIKDYRSFTSRISLSLWLVILLCQADDSFLSGQ